jgi:hypothetical protein
MELGIGRKREQSRNLRINHSLVSSTKRLDHLTPELEIKSLPCLPDDGD